MLSLNLHLSSLVTKEPRLFLAVSFFFFGPVSEWKTVWFYSVYWEKVLLSVVVLLPIGVGFISAPFYTTHLFRGSVLTIFESNSLKSHVTVNNQSTSAYVISTVSDMNFGLFLLSHNYATYTLYPLSSIPRMLVGNTFSIF